jgi:hypothetical protein
MDTQNPNTHLVQHEGKHEVVDTNVYVSFLKHVRGISVRALFVDVTYQDINIMYSYVTNKSWNCSRNPTKVFCHLRYPLKII